MICGHACCFVSMLLCWHAYLSYWQKRFVLAVIPNAALADSLFPLVEEGPVAFKLFFCFA